MSGIKTVGLSVVAATAFAGLGVVSAQTQVGREMPTGAPAIAGATRGPSYLGEAGEPGRAGGMGTVEPNLVKDVKGASDLLFGAANRGVTEEIKTGPGLGRANVAVPLSHSLRVPLLEWGFRPEDAEVKIGQFYLDFRSLAGHLLFSDNANHSQTDKKSGFISIISLQLAALFQFEERMRLAVGGTVSYLPFENEIGFGDPLETLGLSFSPRLKFAFSYHLPLGYWNLDLYDDFQIHSYTPGYYWNEHYDFLDSDNQGIDQIGNYSFRLPTDPDQRLAKRDLVFDDKMIFHNTVGATASRLVPTETLISFGASRHDYWYSGFDNDLTKYMYQAYARAESKRENMRFKPHIGYRATTTSSQDGWDQVLYGGVKGPVTDYIDFLGQVGYHWDTDSSNSRLLWMLRLKHDISPSLSHGVLYNRYVSYPNKVVQTGIYYQLQAILGPDLRGEVFGGRVRYERNTFGSDSTFTQIGARLNYAMSTRLSLLAATYHNWWDRTAQDSQGWVAIGMIRLALSDKLDAFLTYRHETRDYDNNNNAGYSENRVVLSVVRSF